FGYQGQFAEKDEETGYNSFELRLYDARIGRWLTTDPYGQFWSPYLGMANNPVSAIDPTGGIVPNFENLETGAIEYFDPGVDPGAGYKFVEWVQKDFDFVNNAIRNGGWDSFIGFVNDKYLGSDFFFEMAHTYNFEREGWLGNLIDRSPIVADGFFISEWTHSEIANGTAQANALEHHIGSFLMTGKWGPGGAGAITTANEIRGLIINDRISGNMKEAIRGLPARDGGATAFEWSDLKNNMIGGWYYTKWHFSTYVFNKNAWFNGTPCNPKVYH
ncbi:MAG TPA: hypothetical protein DDX98_10680, partial [Bacteroidales bacterium]|nr:hypothetical protein [Bacteroidales bacterium]